MVRAIVLAVTCLLTCVAATSPAPAPQLLGVAYREDGSDAHRLDIYLPKELATAQLIVFVHGGAFMAGGRRDYAPIGRALAVQGMAVVVPSYQLFPAVGAQGSTSDVAFAIAWTIEHARDYGLASAPLFLAGHSAGAQIVAMIATHGRYLESAGASLASIRGALVLAGAYDVRDLSDEPESWQRIDDQIYGATSEERAKNSPGLAIDPKTPPIEAVCGTEDDPGSCPRTEHFVRALRSAGLNGRIFRAVGADHMALLRRLIGPNDPLHAEFRQFIERQRKDAP